MSGSSPWGERPTWCLLLHPPEARLRHFPKLFAVLERRDATDSSHLAPVLPSNMFAPSAEGGESLANTLKNKLQGLAGGIRACWGPWFRGSGSSASASGFTTPCSTSSLGNGFIAPGSRLQTTLVPCSQPRQAPQTPCMLARVLPKPPCSVSSPRRGASLLRVGFLLCVGKPPCFALDPCSMSGFTEASLLPSTSDLRSQFLALTSGATRRPPRFGLSRVGLLLPSASDLRSQFLASASGAPRRPPCSVSSPRWPPHFGLSTSAPFPLRPISASASRLRFGPGGSFPQSASVGSNFGLCPSA